MDVKLKSIKDYPSMSEETSCFQADLWVGNQKVAHIRNSGRGGCDDVHPYEGMRPLLNKVEEYCKTLPPHKTHFGGKERELKMDLELLTIDLMEEWRLSKDFKKAIVFKKADGSTWEHKFKGWTITKLLTQPNGIVALRRVCAKIVLDGHTILNTNIDSIYPLI